MECIECGDEHYQSTKICKRCYEQSRERYPYRMYSKLKTRLKGKQNLIVTQSEFINWLKNDTDYNTYYIHWREHGCIKEYGFGISIDTDDVNVYLFNLKLKPNRRLSMSVYGKVYCPKCNNPLPDNSNGIDVHVYCPICKRYKLPKKDRDAINNSKIFCGNIKTKEIIVFDAIKETMEYTGAPKVKVLSVCAEASARYKEFIFRYESDYNIDEFTKLVNDTIYKKPLKETEFTVIDVENDTAITVTGLNEVAKYIGSTYQTAYKLISGNTKEYKGFRVIIRGS